MRVIVDANQVSAILNRHSIPDLVLPSYVLAEILLRSDTKAILKKIVDIRPKLGLEPVKAFDVIAGLSERQIRDFEPFAASNFVYLPEFLDTAKSLARQMKDQHLNFCGLMFEKAKEFRKTLIGRPAVKFHDMAEAILCLPSFSEMVLDWVSNGGKRELAVSNKERLYDAVMQNQHFGNFFKSILYYLISFSRAWKDQKHNFDPTATRDDWTDIVLPLYCAKGDYLLTADTKVQQAIAMIEPLGGLHAGTAIPDASPWG